MFIYRSGFVLFLCAIGCRASSAADSGTVTDVKSCKHVHQSNGNDLVTEVDREWRLRCEKMGPMDPKLAYGRWVKELEAVISSRVPKERLCEYMLAITAKSASSTSADWYHRATVEALTVLLATRGERKTMVELLSRAFPVRIYYSDVEF